MKTMKKKPAIATNGAATPEDVLLTPPETMAKLKCCRHTLRRLELKGLLHPTRITRKLVRYKLSDVAQLTA